MLRRGLWSFGEMVFFVDSQPLGSTTMLQACKRTGAVIEIIPSDEVGELDLNALENMLSAGGVKAVVITHVPTNGGVVNPAQEGPRCISGRVH